MRKSSDNYSQILNNLAIDLEPRLERLLFKICYHASATLAGIKPANLLTFRDGCSGSYQTDWQDLQGEIANLLPIDFTVLSRQPKGCNVLFYNRQMLTSLIQSADINRFLKTKGYRQTDNLDAVFIQLGHQFNACCPSEIGVFLGYPLSDVIAFTKRDQPCLLTGYWQVFSNMHLAKQRFNHYDRARQVVADTLSAGISPSHYLQCLQPQLLQAI